MAKQLYWEDVKEGSEVTPLAKVATTQMLVKFAGLVESLEVDDERMLLEDLRVAPALGPIELRDDETFVRADLVDAVLCHRTKIMQLLMILRFCIFPLISTHIIPGLDGWTKWGKGKGWVILSTYLCPQEQTMQVLWQRLKKFCFLLRLNSLLT